MEDLISREKAIEALLKEFERDTPKAIRAKLTLENLPSAQPEKRTDKHTETHARDLIERQDAIDALHRYFDGMLETDTWSPCDIYGLIEILPSAQPDSKELSPTHKALDTISRQAAIDALTSHIMPHNNEDGTVTIGVLSKSSIKNILNKLPPAQPETHEERTETHACDYINRKDAIEAHYEYCNKHPDAGFPVWSLKILEDLPSAQPEPCVDTIDALDESIKHFDDMAEECRRNANIEQNDYMDMRDDAAEYRQLSIWLNELKWLRERFQSQPDLSEYSDKLWKKAYERGKAEAQQRWIPCSERLPEQPNPNPELEGKPLDIYLVCKQDNIPFRAFWNGRNFADGWTSLDVDAWMPLPKPYRTERRTDVDANT